MITRPIREQTINGLLPAHRILTANGEEVVDSVTRTADAWEVATRPAGRPTGRRIVHRFPLDPDAAFVIRLAGDDDMAIIRRELASSIEAAAALELEAQRKAAGDGLHVKPVATVSVTDLPTTHPGELVVEVRAKGEKWTVRV